MAVLAPGGIIQEVVNASSTRVNLSTTTTGTWFETSSAYRVSITPHLTNSKIVLRAFLPVNQQGGTNCLVNMTYQRSTNNGSTWADISNIGTTAGQRRNMITTVRPYGYDGNDATEHVFFGVDTPNTTSTCLYRMVFQFNDGNANWYVNYSQYDNPHWQWTGCMTITATEVGS